MLKSLKSITIELSSSFVGDLNQVLADLNLIMSKGILNPLGPFNCFIAEGITNSG